MVIISKLDSSAAMLKFSGNKEEEEDNTDKSILNIVNKVVLKGTGHNFDISSIDCSHRVGPTIQGKPRDIIVRFLSYRDRDLIYLNKKNFKSYNNKPSNNNRVFINEALTRTRAKLFARTRRLHKEKLIDGCWTMDG